NPTIATKPVNETLPLSNSRENGKPHPQLNKSPPPNQFSWKLIKFLIRENQIRELQIRRFSHPTQSFNAKNNEMSALTTIDLISFQSRSKPFRSFQRTE
ncbi:hypothetical protein CEXT_648921, partial [Caerostris extrusa]